MKSILAIVCVIGLAVVPVLAVNDVPGSINYQGRLLNSSGASVTDGTYTIASRLYGGPSGANPLWGASHSVVISAGNFNVVLGEGGSAVSNAQGTNILAGLGATTTPYLGLTVLTDSSGATLNNPQEIQPRMRLLSSPYALVAEAARMSDTSAYATNAGTLGGLLPSQFLQPGSTAPSTLGGALTVPSLAVTGALTVQGHATVQGNTRVHGTLSATATSGGGFVPVGGIIMWSGSVTAIPAGWALCDGGRTSTGTTTPDLRDRFIVGASSTVAVGAVGGRSSVTLSAANLPPHQHTYKDTIFAEHNVSGSTQSPDGLDTGSEGGNNYRGSSHGYDSDNNLSWVRRRSDSAYGNSGGGADPIDLRPPYYALAFIIRVE